MKKILIMALFTLLLAGCSNGEIAKQTNTSQQFIGKPIKTNANLVVAELPIANETQTPINANVITKTQPTKPKATIQQPIIVPLTNKPVPIAPSPININTAPTNTIVAPTNTNLAPVAVKPIENMVINISDNHGLNQTLTLYPNNLDEILYFNSGYEYKKGDNFKITVSFVSGIKSPIYGFFISNSTYNFTCGGTTNTFFHDFIYGLDKTIVGIAICGGTYNYPYKGNIVITYKNSSYGK